MKGLCGIFATTEHKTGQKLAYPTEYLSKYLINLYPIFIICKKNDEDYEMDIHLVIAQGAFI